jgi:hypothetical protein
MTTANIPTTNAGKYPKNALFNNCLKESSTFKAKIIGTKWCRICMKHIYSLTQGNLKSVIVDWHFVPFIFTGDSQRGH